MYKHLNPEGLYSCGEGLTVRALPGSEGLGLERQ